MSLTIPASSTIAAVSSQATAAAVPASGKHGEFASVLDGAIQAVETPRRDANQAIQNLLNGDEELHTVALAAQRADLAFDLGLQIRNKVVSAYQEIMRMQM